MSNDFYGIKVDGDGFGKTVDTLRSRLSKLIETNNTFMNSIVSSQKYVNAERTVELLSLLTKVTLTTEKQAVRVNDLCFLILERGEMIAKVTDTLPRRSIQEHNIVKRRYNTIRNTMKKPDSFNLCGDLQLHPTIALSWCSLVKELFQQVEELQKVLENIILIASEYDIAFMKSISEYAFSIYSDIQEEIYEPLQMLIRMDLCKSMYSKAM